MPRRAVVVGAGIVGLSSAFELLKRGFEVTVLERDQSLGGGCSFGNAGMIVPSHFMPLASPEMFRAGLKMFFRRGAPFGIENLADLETLGWISRFWKASRTGDLERSSRLLRDLNIASRDIYSQWSGDLKIARGFAHRGLLMISRTSAAHDAEAHMAAEARRLGLAADILDPDGIRDLEPGIRISAAGAVHFQDDAHLDPQETMRALENQVESLGGEIRRGCHVQEVNIADGKLQSVGGHDAEEFIFAGGAWTGELARRIGLRLPLLAGRGYGFTVSSPPERPTIPSIFTEARVALTPYESGIRFVGTLELARPRLAAGSGRVQEMKRQIPLYYTAFRPADLEGELWCGLRPCSPDGLPYLGRTARARNLTIATGHGMMGMSLGPVTGKLVGEIVSGDAPSLPLELLSPDRYA